MGATIAVETDRKLRLTRAHVSALLNAGLLNDGRYELLAGDLILKMPQNPPHTQSCRKTTFALEDIFGREQVGSQGPVAIDATNEPEPDVYVLQESLLTYSETPTSADVRLIVEVSDSTLSVDRNEKMRLYGGGGIPEYWVVDVNRRRVIVHRDPQEDGYGSIETLSETASVRPLSAPNDEVAVVSLLP
jgi:Uma2 family endonuclease